MKKLLIVTIAALLVASIQAQPVAQDASFFSLAAGYSGDLAPLVQGGTPPYQYTLLDVNHDDMEVGIYGWGQFRAGVPVRVINKEATFRPLEAQFRYTATDADGDVSNPGTITINFGPEKG